MKANIIQALVLEISDICMEMIKIEEGNIFSSRETTLPKKEWKVATKIRQVFEKAETKVKNGDSDEKCIESKDSESKNT